MPEAVEQKFNYIKDPKRRKFAGMLYKLDQSVGEITQTLQEAGSLQDSIIGIIFLVTKSFRGNVFPEYLEKKTEATA